MNSQKKTLFYFVLFAIAFNGICAQSITLQKQLNLQTNEVYVQHLSEFIDQPIQQINWPTNYAQLQIVEAYNVQKISTTSPPVTPLARFRVGETTEYLIGIQQQTAQDNTVQLIVTYQMISLDSSCNCLKLSNIATQQIDQFPLGPKNCYASFYSQTQGFISYMNNDVFKSYQFTYTNSDTSPFTFTLISDLYLYDHVAIVGPSNTVYVIQQVINKYQLYKFDSASTPPFKPISYSDAPAVQCMYDMPIIDTGRYYLNYCFDNNRIYTVSINYYDNTLFVDYYQLSNTAAYSYTYKRFGELLVIALGDMYSLSVITFQSNDSNVSEVFQEINFVEIPFKFSRMTLISPNIIAGYTDNVLSIVNINKKTVVFQTQPTGSNYFIKSISSIGSLTLLQIFDQKNNYVKTLSASISLPQLTIDTTINTVVSPIILQLQTVNGININISIQFNVSNQNSVLFTQPSISMQDTSTYLSTSIELIPIENYIVGANLQLNIAPAQKGIFQKISVQQALALAVSGQQQEFSKDCQFYQTDGGFSSLVFCPVQAAGQTIYTAYAVSPMSVGYEIGSTQNKKSEINFSYPISIIDNQGSFITTEQQVPNYQINMPFIQLQNLRINIYTVQCTQTFLFATDPAASVLFTICGNVLTQYILRRYAANNVAQLVSQTPLSTKNLVVSAITNLICLKGTLFIYNGSTIFAYDYINFGFIGSIAIPSIGQGKTQQITIYKESFLITVVDTPLTKIAQYSYNNFSGIGAVPMRNLQIDSTYQINTSGKIIAIRDYKELAVIQSTTAGLYYIYRIGSLQWSNQLYTSILIQSPSLSVFSSAFIFQFNPNSFIQILDETSIQYALAITPEQYASNLSYAVQFTISNQQQGNSMSVKSSMRSLTQLNKDKENIDAITTQQYTLVLNRDASAQFGHVDQQSQAVQQLKTQLQDTNFGTGQVFNFNDTAAYNACLVGWYGDQNAAIVSRLNASNPAKGSLTYTILYQYSATITSEQIQSFFTISGDFNNCVLLDDKGSFTSTNNKNSFNLYVICASSISQYIINFELAPQTNTPTNVSVGANPQKYSFTPTTDTPIESFAKIISANKSLYIFIIDGVTGYNLVLNSQTNIATLTELDNSYYFKRSINVINQSNLQLFIYSSGVITTQITSGTTINVVNLSDLLTPFNFIVDGEDTISTVDQYSDTQFRIAIGDYIYDITFKYNNSLQIEAVSQYYYQDAFLGYYSGIKGSKYTLLFGRNVAGQDFAVGLYSNTPNQNNIFLIQSKYEAVLLGSFITPTYVFEQNPNQFVVNLSDGYSITITIADTLGVKVNFAKSSLKQNTVVSITPQSQNLPGNTILINFQGSGGSGSTTASLLNIAILNILGIMILLI